VDVSTCKRLLFRGTPDEYHYYHEVPTLAGGARKLAGERTIVWYSAPGLHTPRDEDFGPGGFDATKGVALTTWIEFTLRPRNLFDSTPLYAPIKK
jgi:Cu2+-containing amine oxidase